MKNNLAPEQTLRWRRVRQVSFGGAVIAFAVAACTDDAIVYPNRNTAALAGSAGVLAAAGEGGENSIGGSGAGGSGAGGSGTVNEGGASGADNGPRCGDGIVQPPEECDDGNPLSGDGCSYDCRSECETCESKVCSLPSYDTANIGSVMYDSCYDQKGIILKGPAATVPRAEVCRELVDCIRTQKCAQMRGTTIVNFYRCWCDVDWNSGNPFTTCQNPLTFVPGKCADLFQDASEGDTLADVGSTLTRTAAALGQAMRLLQGCDARVCVEECLPEYFGNHTVATITEDLVRAPNSSGESQLGDLTADAQRTVAGSDLAIVRFDALCLEGEDGSPSSELTFHATPGRSADADGRVLWSEALATQYCYGGGAFLTTGHNDGPAGTSVLSETLTGQQLYDALTVGLGGPAAEGTVRRPFYVSGISYTWQNAIAPALPSIVEVRKDGIAIDRSATYSVALSDSLAKGALASIPGGNATAIPNSFPPTLFGQYLSQLPQPVSPPPTTRITLLTPSGG